MRLARCVPSFATATAVALVLGACGASAQTAPAPSAAPAADPAAAAAAPQLGANIAAVVNDQIITTYDVQQRALLVALSSGVRPNQENTPALLQQALRQLIDERLQLQELRNVEREQKFSIIADEKELDQQIADIARDNNGKTADQLKAELAAFGIDISTMREQLRAQTSWQRFISGRYGSRIRIGNDQIDKAMQRLNAAMNKPQYQVSEIFIDSAKAGGMEEAMNGARQLVTQIQQGAPFPAVARQFSGAATAANGGDMGWVSLNELRPEVQTAVAQLPPMQISQPVPVSDGVYILAVRDRRVGGSSTRVALKQAAVRLAADAGEAQLAEANRQLAALKALNPTCSDIEAKAGQVPGVVAGQLGESDINELNPVFRGPVESLAENQPSDPVRTQAGLHMLMVCSRKQVTADMPSREQIEQRLRGEQLTMISRRQLRDLRSSATIETP